MNNTCDDLFISDSERRDETHDDDRERRFSREQLSPRQFKKQGGRHSGRGATQSGYRPPANPNAFNPSQERREKEVRER